MKLKRRSEDGFNLSFLDVMACGLGAVILIFILLDFNSYSSDPSEEQEKLQQELAAAQQQQRQLQQAMAQLQQQIATEQGKQESSSQAQHQATETQQRLLEDISRQAATVAELDQQLAALLKMPLPDANLALAGKGEQNYITGMKVEGAHIGLLIDKSASMMADNLVAVLTHLALADAQKKLTEKWQRTLRVARWLMARLPQQSQLTTVVFSDSAQVLGSQSTIAVTDKKALQQVVSQLNDVVPNGGTNLQMGLQALYKANPKITDLYLVTDGLPTLGDGLPLRCRNFISRKKSISSECRQLLFANTLSKLPKAARANIILLPIEGDPYASSLYWQWALTSGGVFLSPAPEWP